MAYWHESNQHPSWRGEPWHLPHCLLPPRILFCLPHPSKGCLIKRHRQFIWPMKSQHRKKTHLHHRNALYRPLAVSVGSLKILHHCEIWNHYNIHVKTHLLNILSSHSDFLMYPALKTSERWNLCFMSYDWYLFSLQFFLCWRHEESLALIKTAATPCPYTNTHREMVHGGPFTCFVLMVAVTDGFLVHVHEARIPVSIILHATRATQPCLCHHSLLAFLWDWYSLPSGWFGR